MAMISKYPALPAEIDELRRSIAKLRGQNDELTARLQALGQELARANKALKAEVIERMRVEQELKDVHGQLLSTEGMAAIGQMANGVGHELRNPLGAIKNAAFYLRRKIARGELLVGEPRVLEFLEIIDAEVNSANKVIADLLGFSGLTRPNILPVNIGGLIEDTLGQLSLPGNIKLRKNLSPPLPRVLVDTGQIRQVIINLVLNAVEAMPDGGCLRVGVRAGDGFVRVEFADTGCGIPLPVMDKIFDPLFTTKAKGVGLGLAVCRSILQRHGGGIAVASPPGKGAVFTISLPAGGPR